MSSVREFMEQHFLHFNSREVVAAARAWEAHLAAGGKMLVSLAGAMSTARIGKTLSRLIRADMVHAISCTGANLEEDVFALLAAPEYETIPDWRALRAEDEAALLARGMNRVTDVCIPETVMLDLDARLLQRWQRACEDGTAKMPSEYLWDLLDDPQVRSRFALPAEDSWVLAARERGVPIFTPGWEDSSLGNAFSAFVMKGDLPHHRCIMPGTEVMTRLMRWYLDHCNRA
ncbi:MAG: deoxyhypusine synthase family protein, partial [Nannocystaceae bacterium]